MDSIKTEQDIVEGLEKLSRLDQTLLPIIKQTPSVPLRREQSGFAGLVRIIIGQHVSTASAAAIHGRFIKAIHPITPKRYLQTPEKNPDPNRPDPSKTGNNYQSCKRHSGWSA